MPSEDDKNKGENEPSEDDTEKDENTPAGDGEENDEVVPPGDGNKEDDKIPDGGISGNDVGEEPEEEEDFPSVSENTTSVSENTISISENSLSITANNSLGLLLLEEIQFEARNTEAEAAASHAIADIEVSGTEAEVLLHAKEDCTAVVAIYEEGSEKPYAFGSAVVDAGENRAVVEIEASSLP